MSQLLTRPKSPQPANGEAGNICVCLSVPEVGLILMSQGQGSGHSQLACESPVPFMDTSKGTILFVLISVAGPMCI